MRRLQQQQRQNLNPQSSSEVQAQLQKSALSVLLGEPPAKPPSKTIPSWGRYGCFVSTEKPGIAAIHEYKLYRDWVKCTKDTKTYPSGVCHGDVRAFLYHIVEVFNGYGSKEELLKLDGGGESSDTHTDTSPLEALLFDHEKILQFLGRDCSLSLASLKKHGTIEFRRCHSCLDEEYLTRWAYFCVSFVEVFSTKEKVEKMLGEWFGIGLDENQKSNDESESSSSSSRLKPMNIKSVLKKLQPLQNSLTCDGLTGCCFGLEIPKVLFS